MKRQSSGGNREARGSDPSPTSVSVRTFVLSAAVCALFSFAVGYSLDPLLTCYEQFLQQRREASEEIQYIREQDETFGEQCGSAYHPISFFRKKSQAPPTKYSSKTFYGNDNDQCSTTFDMSPNTSKGFSKKMLSSGGHLLVDMRGVDGDFLDSSSRLGHAIVTTARESSLNMLSFHCHQMVPCGVSCIGLMSEGYMSFHTWPEEQVITFDMFASGTFEITDFMPSIERNFGVSRNGPPTVIWGHKLRGRKDGVKTTDLTRRILGFTGVDVKKEIASFETEHQKIQVHDVVKKDLANIMADSHETNRILHLNGAIQSSLPSFYEALVHPAMFSHANPQRVVIAGGGYGSALREVLKHSSVKSATMIELDEHVVDVTKEFLPELHDCTDLVGVADVCLDDPKATVQYEDAEAWFVNRYANKNNILGDLLDVVIINSIDPHVDLPSSDQLHVHAKFVQSLYNSLSDDGIVVMLMGKAPEVTDAPNTPPIKHRGIMTRMLQQAGFGGTVAYEETHGGFNGPRSFLVAFKSETSRNHWLASEAVKEHDMISRAVPTASGESPFRYYDGAIMTSYQRQEQDDDEATNCIGKDELVSYLEKAKSPEDWSRQLSQLPAICKETK